MSSVVVRLSIIKGERAMDIPRFKSVSGQGTFLIQLHFTSQETIQLLYIVLPVESVLNLELTINII